MRMAAAHRPPAAAAERRGEGKKDRLGFLG